MSDDASLQLTYTESQFKDVLRDALSDQAKRHWKIAVEFIETTAVLVEGIKITGTNEARLGAEIALRDAAATIRSQAATIRESLD